MIASDAHTCAVCHSALCDQDNTTLDADGEPVCEECVAAQAEAALGEENAP